MALRSSSSLGGALVKKTLGIMATLVLGAILVPATFAQQGQPAQQQSPGMSQPDEGSAQSQQSPSEYTGTVMKSAGKYVLKTDAGTLQLDDQTKAKKYAGKQVTVSGTVDKGTGMIHVSEITPAMQH
jgi:lipopolysaccharide export system protein LptA